MKNFITNSGEQHLNNRLIELIEKAEELKFLVGFFYFSGLQELYAGLKQNPDVTLKILVGLNVDKTAHGLIEYGDALKNLSDDERTFLFFKSIKTSVNTENFDNNTFYEQVRFFLDLIKQDKLILRKTHEPNHAKLYIFKLTAGQVGRNRLFITGSSNLTSSGLKEQHEFNVEISDYGVEDAEEYFDALWNKAVLVTEHEPTKARLIRLLEKDTLIKAITPFEAYAYVLKTYLDTFQGKSLGQRVIEVLRENEYKTYQYQLDAISQALAIIEQNNGVIIADVVGLGKTVIASAVAFEMKKRGIVIAPPGIVGDKRKESGWKRYLEDFHLTSLGWDAYSSGDLETVMNVVSQAKDIEVVIIDEAHRFRNQDTQDYEYLKNICRGKIVILLTATPFNNRPADIFSLLKLFITPKRSSITLSDNLEAEFDIFRIIFDKLAYISRYYTSSDSKKSNRALSLYKSIFGKDVIDIKDVKYRAHYLAKQIKEVIEPVTIRRNRLDLQKNPSYRDEVKDLSRVEDPKEWFFELTKEQSEFYDTIINKYFALPDNGGRFKGAIYKPFVYEKGKTPDLFEVDLTEEENRQYQQQANLYDFMRRLLVKRFESSFGAFRQSLINFKDITRIVKEFLDKKGKYILDRALVQKIYKEDEDTIEEALKNYAEQIRKGEYPKNHKIYEIDNFKDKQGFLSDIDADMALFDEILKQIDNLKLVAVGNDPKSACLIKNISGILNASRKKGGPKRKVIIFSEYKDTVEYLNPILKGAFDDRVLVISGNLAASEVKDINRNFDASSQEQDDTYDILLTTDKLSEGFNLNRAGMVINYDIPWNPVRVIQRVGRINRISKKVFESLNIVNFFPTEKGADLVKSREIAGNKMFLIHNALGEDAKIFDIDEAPSPSGLYNKILQNPEGMEQESFYTRLLNDYEQIKEKHPELIASFKDYPPRIKVAKKGKEDELFVVIKKGRLFVHHKRYAEIDDKPSISVVALEDIYEKIIAEENEQALPLSKKFWEHYEGSKNFRKQTTSIPKEQSLEQKSINVLNTLMRTTGYDALIPHTDFLRMLLEDIIDYGNLADYTLRRIIMFDVKNIDCTVKAIVKLKKELGEDYLYREKDSLKELTKEIIIAIENRAM
ncbi:MAG: phospholipase D-like domain-containing protein [Deltaproteobacteria bacterium]|nr:phospholipase D-like domain-containing protein [Deltaproteobacteria bacterium]MCL5792728.1 phospholipase D-like domain-containing protein [Deltaproteobacteria bacterium]